MAGQYGVDRVTVRNLKLFSIDKEKNQMLIRGAIPGPNGGLVVVRFPKEPPRSQV
jgi:large subunit ribosomal protein L3